MIQTGKVQTKTNHNMKYLTFDIFCANCGRMLGYKTYVRNTKTGRVEDYSTSNWDWEYCPFCGELLYRK